LAVNPKPLQGDGLPIWIGGQGERALRIAATGGCGLMLWFVEPDAIRDYIARFRAAGGTGPVAAAMPLAPNAGRWLELSSQYARAGTDLLIITSYGQASNVTTTLEEFATQVLPEVR
jgi:alkanesulfonate monooxygenase SsuD/methylene tetrahydromethanopterin reductase-like flavin-dependent oxidoreductase (luciferase family)